MGVDTATKTHIQSTLPHTWNDDTLPYLLITHFFIIIQS